MGADRQEIDSVAASFPSRPSVQSCFFLQSVFQAKKVAKSVRFSPGRFSILGKVWFNTRRYEWPTKPIRWLPRQSLVAADLSRHSAATADRFLFLPIVWLNRIGMKRNRKPYVGPNGNLGPVTQLKLRPLEDREWAFSLTGTLTRKDAITEIKNRLGIDLKWEACFSRFIQWQEQQHRLEEYADSIQQRQEFGKLADSDSPESCRHGHAALMMDEAARNRDGKTFIGVARVSLSESRLAQYARKIDVAEQRVELDRKRLHWEIKKYRNAVAAAKPPRSYYAAEERERAVNQILGISDETTAHVRKTNEENSRRQAVEVVGERS